MAFIFGSVGTAGDDVLVARTGGTLDGGASFDTFLLGGGADVLRFDRGDSAPSEAFHGYGDLVIGFDAAADKLHLAVSPKEVFFEDTDFGTVVTYGGIGGEGVDAGNIFLLGAHGLTGTNFIF